MRYLLFAAALLAAVGCSKTDLQNPENPNTSTGKVVLKASAGTGSKVGFEETTDGLKVSWKTDDTFSLYDATGNLVDDFKLKSGEEGKTTAEFEQVGTNPINEGDTYTVVYPSTGAATLAEYKVDLNSQTQDGSDPMSHMGSLCRMQHNDYVYAPTSTIHFAHSHAIMTLKLVKPADFDANDGTAPNKVVLRNGTKTYNLNLANIAWTSDITAYVMIDPTDAGGQDITVNVYTDKFGYNAKITSTKPYEAGLRYTATYPAFTATRGYTLADADQIPAGTTNFIILDKVTTATTAMAFIKLQDYLKASADNVTISMPNAEHIPDMAFAECEKLIAIDMPNVTSLGMGALAYTGLQSIDLSNVTSLGDYVFTECIYLTSVVFNPDLTTLPKGIFQSCYSLESIDISHITSLGEEALSGCVNLKEVTLNPDLTSLPNGMFSGCSALENIDISHITSLGKMVFDRCNLKEVTLNPAITELPESVFYRCPITSINLSNITSIGKSALVGCALTTLDLPEVVSIGDNAFGDGRDEYVNLTTVNMPKVTTLGQGIFEGCTKLENITLPTAITELPDNTFQNCRSLKTIDLSNITTIGNYAFDDCNALAITELPKATAVGDGAFSRCYTLTTLYLPEALSIGGQAFSGYASANPMSLKSITMPKVTSIGSSAFYECFNLENISAPKVTEIGMGAFSTTDASVVSGTIELATDISGDISVGDHVFGGSTDLSKFDLKLGSGVQGVDVGANTWQPTGEFQTYTFKSITVVPVP